MLAIRAELHRRVEIDQNVRTEFLAHGSDHIDPEVVARMQSIDRDNTEWLKGVLARRGWIAARVYGRAATHDAWLLVQHADLDRAFQHQVLSILERAVPVGDATAVELAYLDDRLASAEKRGQRYGTQGLCKPGGWEPYPIDDPSGLEARRKTLGLEPMATYASRLAASCTGAVAPGKR